MATVKKQPQVDYTALLASDPILQAALSGISGQGQRDAGALTAARQQALIGYGQVPDASQLPAGLVGDIAPDVTPQVGELAQQATEGGLSTLAQLQHAYRQLQAGDVAGLIGRNALRSGDYHRLSMENLRGLQVGEAGAQQQLLGQLGGLWQGYQGQQDALAGQANTATQDTLARLTQQIQDGTLGAGGTAATASPAPTGYAPPAPPNTRSPGYEPRPTAGNYGTLTAPPAPAPVKPRAPRATGPFSRRALL